MNFKKHTYLSVFLLLFINFIFSQNCELKSDTLYFVKIDIRSIDDYAIIMNGLSKKINFENFSKVDELSFLGDFYKDAYYCPELIFGAMNNISNSCTDGNYKQLSEKNIVKGCLKIQKRSLEKKMKLLNGKFVTINITKLIADFWVVRKDFKDITESSLEINIKELKEIEFCYIPFRINKILKPNKYFPEIQIKNSF